MYNPAVFINSIKKSLLDAGIRHMIVSRSIRNAILCNYIKKGAFLPPERELAKSLGLSRSTLRKSLSVLIDEGLLTQKNRSGTYVSFMASNDDKLQKNLILNGFSEDIIQRGMTPFSEWLEARNQVASAEINLLLGISPDTKVSSFKRIRYANDFPLAYEESYFPVHILDSRKINLTPNTSLYALLEKLNRKPTRALQTVKAVNCPSDIASYLNITENGAVLEILRRSYSTAEGVLEVTKSFYRGDRYQFFIELGKKTESKE